MPLIDPSSPANVQPVGQTGGYTLTFSDEFNSTSLDSKWTDYADWYLGANTNINYDTNANSNSCLRIWPPSNVATATYNSHGYLSDPDRIIHSRNSFRQLGGYFEWKFRACVGQGQWPGLWTYHETVHDEFDVWEPIVPDTFANSGWGYVRPDGQLSPGNFGGNVWSGNGVSVDPDQVDGRKWSDAGGAPYVPLDMADENTWFWCGVRWDPNASGDNVAYYFYWQGSDGVLRGGQWKTLRFTHQNAMFPLIDLAWGNSGGTVPGSLVKGSSNSMLVDYIRIWQFGVTSTPPSGTFDASLLDAPADGATLTGNGVHFGIAGHNIKNAELLPATGYTPMYGRFSLTNLSASAVTGDLYLDTTALSNGAYTMRISAFDTPPGAASANELVVMASRNYIVSNPGGVFNATAVQAPASSASISGNVAFAVQGELIKRAKLLGPSGSDTVYGNFVINAAGTRGDLTLSTSAVLNGGITFRIDAYDTSADSTAQANVITAMQPRLYYVANTNAPSFTASLASAPVAGASISGIATISVVGTGLGTVELRSASYTSAVIYTRQYDGFPRVYDADGDVPISSSASGGVLMGWLYNGIEDQSMSAGGISPWIIKTSISGAPVTRFGVFPTDNQIYNWRTQWTMAPFEMYKRYRVTIEFMLDAGWVFEANGDGLMFQAMHTHKAGQYANSSFGLNIDPDGTMYFAVLYPTPAYSATSWPASVTWGSGEYVSPTVHASAIYALSRGVWYEVKLEFFADDRPERFGGRGFFSATVNGTPWFTLDRPNIHPDRASSNFGGTDPHWDFGWYNWGRQPGTDRLIYFRQMHVDLLDNTTETPIRRFTVNPGGTSAVLSLTCAEFTGTHRFQVLAYDRAAGTAGSRERQLINDRTYIMATSSAPPLPNPGPTESDRQFIVSDMDGFFSYRLSRRWRR